MALRPGDISPHSFVLCIVLIRLQRSDSDGVGLYSTVQYSSAADHCHTKYKHRRREISVVGRYVIILQPSIITNVVGKLGLGLRNFGELSKCEL